MYIVVYRYRARWRSHKRFELQRPGTISNASGHKNFIAAEFFFFLSDFMIRFCDVEDENDLISYMYRLYVEWHRTSKMVLLLEQCLYVSWELPIL